MLNIIYPSAPLDTIIQEGLFQPDKPYDLLLNGDTIYEMQKQRFQFVQEMGILTSYGLNMSSIDFSAPIEYKNKLIKNKLTANTVDIKQADNLIFHGYITDKTIDNCLAYIDFKSTTFLNLLSKYPVTYTDTTTKSIIPLIMEKLQGLLETLPIKYNISPEVANRQLLDGISVGVNTGTSSIYGIDVVNSLCDTFDIGIYVWNNIIYLYVLPESLAGQPLDISPYIDKPLTTEQKTAIYYEKYSMTYILTPGGADQTAVTAGSGNIIKTFKPENIFFSDLSSAQKLVSRKQRIFSQSWNATETNIDKTLDLKPGDLFSYAGMNFIVYSVEDKYIKKAVKAYGVEI